MGTLFRLLVWVVGAVVAVCGLLYMAVFDVWRIPGDDPLLTASILPTLAPGDLVLLLKRSPGVGRGQLLRCPDPQAAGRFVVARAIGKGGDLLSIESELVALDGRRVGDARACAEPSLAVQNPSNGEDDVLACSIEEFGEVAHPTLRATARIEPPTHLTVEPGRWFLVSDDRHFHLDSRDYGQVDGEACEHIVFRLVGAGGWADSARRLMLIW
jgi:signal peptidase I